MDKKILREKVESLNFKSKDNAESSNSSFNSKPYIYFNETLSAYVVVFHGGFCHYSPNKAGINAYAKPKSNQGIFEPYEKLYEEKHQTEKLFFLTNMTDWKMTEDAKKTTKNYFKELLDKYIVSIEPLAGISDSTTTLSYSGGTPADLKEELDKAFDEEKSCVCVDGECNGRKYYLRFIRVMNKDGTENWDILKNYLELSDSRTYKDTVVVTDWVPTEMNKDNKNTSDLPRNLLIYGAPGTGKSHYMDEQFAKVLYKKYFPCEKKPNGTTTKEYEELFSESKKEIEDENKNQNQNSNDQISDYDVQKFIKSKQVKIKKDYFTRVTFYEDYSYENFVGCYKPIKKDDKITYEFEAGPFIDIYIKAKKDSKHNYLLAIEEINRANAAAVFGDLFQVLDRDNDGSSEYSVKPEAALNKYLEEHLPNYDGTISLPSNLYIWATMNSADQGVHVLDSAFKRRWQFLYMDIDNSESAAKIDDDIYLPVKDGIRKCKWNQFRKAINKVLKDNKIEEDRWVGAWFFKKDELKLIRTFYENKDNTKLKPNPLVDKPLAYLLQDVVKMNKDILFQGKYHNMSSIRKDLSNSNSPKNIFDILNIKIDENALEEVPKTENPTPTNAESAPNGQGEQTQVVTENG